MRYLITGGCGFVGSNLAAEVLKRNEELFVFDNLYRTGSEKNLLWLKDKGDFKFYHCDIRNYNDVENVIKEIKPDVIFHLAGQVAMTTSINDPRMDFEVNALGTLNILEAVRKHSPYTTIVYSSTNKVYGDLEYLKYEEGPTRYVCKEYPNGFDEKVPLDFHSPYGCSKGTADQYLLDYNRMFGVKTVVFRHSSMYGGRQYSTFDQGWIGWFCDQVLKLDKGLISDITTISGNGKQVRDILHVNDVKDLYFMAASKIDIVKGDVFNIGGGVSNSLSLIELFSLLKELTGVSLSYRKLPPRSSDQKVFISNNEKINKRVGWLPKTNYKDGVNDLINWLRS